MKSVIKAVIIAAMGILIVSVVAGCNRNNKRPTLVPHGTGSGTVDLTGDKPEIALSDVVAVVGTDIDYTSQLDIKNEQDFPDLEIWVNASGVDIYTPGEYTAKYTFYWGDKQITASINVTIVEGETSESTEISGEDSSEKVTTKNPVTSEKDTTKKQPTTEKDTTKKQPTTEKPTTTKKQPTTEKLTTTKKQPTTEKPTTTKNQPTTEEQTTTKKQPTTEKQTTTKNQPTTEKQTTTKKQPTTEKQTTEEITTTKVFIPSTSVSETTVTDLGYMYVELLSGSTVRIKVTSARYIVSTRTDVSVVTKKGYTYEVSKLIITFNTGTEQVLETVEKKLS